MFALLQKEERGHTLGRSLKRFVRKGNWNGVAFEKLDSLLTDMAHGLQQGSIFRSDIAEITTYFTDEFLSETLQGHGLRKPYGYPGDFLLLDKIYTSYKTGNPKYRIWDDYFQLQAAPQAVRNRKEYFKKWVLSKITGHGCLNLLNVVSGPGRELYETYTLLPKGKKIKTNCVEVDDYAIAYSRNLNSEFDRDIEYVHSNIFKFQNERKYDLIWSAGLFDYLNDGAFLTLLDRFKDWLLPGGEIVIGNFNEDNNPSRPYMEIMGDWHLVHRTEEQLRKLACRAGFRNDRIRVGREKLNVNLFLHLGDGQHL